MSRLQAINNRVQTHVTSQIPGVTVSNDPNAFHNLPSEAFPHALITFEEDDPEILDFKQERRRVVGSITLGYLKSDDDDEKISREIANLDIEEIRDAIFADPDLSATVDNVRVEAAFLFTGRDDPKVYATLEVSTDEVF